MITEGCRGLPGVTGVKLGYKGFFLVDTRVYRGLRALPGVTGVTRVYRVFQGFKRNQNGLDGFTRSYNGLQVVTRG